MDTLFAMDDKEEWAPIKLEGCEKYEASTWGRVRNAKTKYILKTPKPNGGGHIEYNLCTDEGTKVNAKASRLVASAFLPDWTTDPDMEVDHIDSDRANDRRDNLQMVTRSENCLKQDNTNKGAGLRVPVEQWTMDGTLVATHVSVTDAAAAMGKTSRNSISACLAGKRESAYGHVWRYVAHTDLAGEIWKPFRKTVLISNMGRYRRTLQTGQWGQAKTASEMSQMNGYASFGVDGKQHRLHVAVATLFVDNDDEKPYAAFLDKDHMNVAASNLVWETPSETNLRTTARKVPVRQLTIDGTCVAEYESITEASEATGISTSNISNVLAKRTKTASGFVWTLRADAGSTDPMDLAV